MSEIGVSYSDRARLFLEGGNAWEKILEKAAQETAKRLYRAMLDSMEEKLASQPTGRARGGLVPKVEKNGDGYDVTVGWLTGSGGIPNPVYIRQLNYGGFIPKDGPMPKGKFLVFEWQGKTVFAKRVFQEGRHFIEPVQDRAQTIAGEEFHRALRDGVNALRGG